MTVQDENTTRTPAPNDAEAPDQTGTSEPAVQDERTDPSKAEYHKRQALENKQKAETLNALYAKYGVSSVEELNERLAQSPAAPAHDEPTMAEDDDEADVRAAEEFAAKGDPVAKLALKVARRNRELAQGVADAFVARDIPDKTERAQAIAHYNKNRHRLDFKAALAEVRAVKQEAELTRLRDELTTLKKAPDPDVVNAPRTHGREIASDQTQSRKKMRESEVDAQIAALRSQGRNSEVMALQRRIRKNEVDVAWGQ